MPRERLRKKIECPECGKAIHIDSASTHWSRSCTYPELTDRQLKIAIGLLLGDGSIRKRQKSMRMEMTNLPFLEWVSDEMDFAASPVTLKAKGEEIARRQMACETNSIVNPEKVKDIYRLSIYGFPEIVELSDWYINGSKEIPDKLELTPALVKVWYCCDGNLAFGGNKEQNRTKANPVIAMSAQDVEIIENIAQKFRKIGFGCTVQKEEQIYIRTNSVSKFFNWMGDPCPGFSYKWQWEDKSLYKAYKKKADGVDGAEKLIEERTVNYNSATSW